ncbi:MAG: polysaccharide biosynthesis tyrosine autokinase [Muribaculaceae bacterium]|nr:polysaccharide biosynthesis tyrosine autokinase [Muribaculaceae bacterium]
MANKVKPQDFIDINAIIRNYRKKWYWFVISVVMFGLLGYVYVKTHNTEYSVHANVLIDDDNSNPLLSSMDLGGLFGTSARVDDEVFIVSSHSLLRDIVKQLNLNECHIVKKGLLEKEFAYPDYPLGISNSAAFADTLTASLMFKISVDADCKAKVKFYVKGDKIETYDDVAIPGEVSTPYGKFELLPTATYPKGEELNTIIYLSGYDAQAEQLAKDIEIELVNRKSNVITMAMQTENVAYGKNILDAIVKQYNLRGLDDKSAQGEKTLLFIDERIRLLASDLDDAESAIQAYKQANGIIDVQAEAVYQTTRRSELDKRLLQAESEAEVLKLATDFVNNPENAYSLIPLTVTNEGLIKSISTYNGLLLKRIELQSNAKGNNAVLRSLEEQIDAMRGNVATSIRKAYDNAMVPVRELRAEMAKTSGQLGKVPTQEREFINMKRQQEVKQALYLFLLQRREETAMMIANTKPKAIIVDEAYALNDPISMKPKLVLAMFLFLGFLVPLILLYIKDKLRTKFDTRQEVERIVDMPVLGEICTDKSGTKVVVGSNDTSSSAELFRLLRTNLLFVLNDTRDKVVLMTSTNSGEGKSYISINLAMSLSLLGKKVLLMGMDIRKPKLAEYLGLSARYGITQYLSSDNISIDDMIIRDKQYGNLDIMLSGPIPPNPAELLALTKVDALFAELRERYDYIIVDTAPVGLVSDTFTLDRISDATIYVCRANYTSKADLAFANSIYDQHRLRKLSLVVNGAAMKKNYGYSHN